MSVLFLRRFWRVIRTPLVWLTAKKLQRTGKVSKALNIALVDVREQNLADFKQNLAKLQASFDRILVDWNAQAEAPISNQQLIVSTSLTRDSNRWQLLSQCEAGFMFPVDVRFVPSPQQIRHLRDHLNSFGGYAAVTSLAYEVPSQKPISLGCTMAESSNISIDHLIFDQRYWKLTAEEFTDGNEIENFIRAARLREFSILACESTSSESTSPVAGSAQASKIGDTQDRLSRV